MSYWFLAFRTNVLLNLCCPGHLSYYSPNESEPLLTCKYLIFMLQNAVFCDDILKKKISFWGRCPQTPKRGLAPGPHWGPTAAPRPPHHFPPFSLSPVPCLIPFVCFCPLLDLSDFKVSRSVFHVLRVTFTTMFWDSLSDQMERN